MDILQRILNVLKRAWIDARDAILIQSYQPGARWNVVDVDGAKDLTHLLGRNIAPQNGRIVLFFEGVVSCDSGRSTRGDVAPERLPGTSIYIAGV